MRTHRKIKKASSRDALLPPLLIVGFYLTAIYPHALFSYTTESIGTGGLEPPTPSASRKCSPTELRACKLYTSPHLPAGTKFPIWCQEKNTFFLKLHGRLVQ